MQFRGTDTHGFVKRVLTITYIPIKSEGPVTHSVGTAVGKVSSAGERAGQGFVPGGWSFLGGTGLFMCVSLT